MHKSSKPVRKCHGCKLNLGDRCAIFADPHQRWRSGKCTARNNERLYEQYMETVARHPVDPRKEKRRERARQAKSEPHRDGTLSHKPPFVGGPR